MTPERWQRVQTLFDRAADLQGEARERVLAEADDPDLRREVEAMLAADDTADPLVDGGAASFLDAMSAELEPGTKIQDYVVEARVGAGAFGVVYRAVHPVIDKRAAIKVLDPLLSRDPHHVSRFVTEARAVNAIGHPGIVGAFGFGRTARGAFYCLMDFVDGETLDAALRARGRFTLEEATPILAGIASALDAAHAAGIVHRDLKPANVMVTATGPRLLDFGIAKLIDPLRATDHRTETGQTVGTPAYMAPEQIEGKDVDARTDVYAFGVLAYELLTGTRPFEGTSPIATMMQHLERAPEPPSRRAPIASHVDDVLLGLLAKRPDDRPTGLSEIVARLSIVASRRTSWIPFALAAALVLGAGAFALAPRQESAPVVTPAPPPTPRASIRGTPVGTKVFDARTGAELGAAPGPFEIEAPTEVLLRAEGYRDRTVTLNPGRDVDVTLEPEPTPPVDKPKKRAVHPDLEPM